MASTQLHQVDLVDEILLAFGIYFHWLNRCIVSLLFCFDGDFVYIKEQQLREPVMMQSLLKSGDVEGQRMIAQQLGKLGIGSTVYTTTDGQQSEEPSRIPSFQESNDIDDQRMIEQLLGMGSTVNTTAEEQWRTAIYEVRAARFL